MASPTQILAQFPKQQSPKQLQPSSALGASSVGQTQTTTTSPGAKPTIQIKQESGKPTDCDDILFVVKGVCVFSWWENIFKY